MIAHVAVRDDVFVKSALTVQAGTKVRWNWEGTGRHDVTVVSGPAQFRSSTKRSGHYTHKLTKKGTYHFVCTVHAPKMKMTIKVK
jgi:plastocyanin